MTYDWTTQDPAGGFSLEVPGGDVTYAIYAQAEDYGSRWFGGTRHVGMQPPL